jgi:polysaccharide biosynthesis/export protein
MRKMSFTRPRRGEHGPIFPSVPTGPKRTGARRALRIALPVLIGMLPGCADTRISVHELAEREQSIVTANPVEVQPQNLGLIELRPYQVGPGDVLNVAITGLPAEGQAPAAAPGPLHARVHPDGKISLPLVGPLQVAGLTLAGVEEAITTAYVPNYVKTISVFVELATADEPTTVIVRGAAGTPGLVTLKNNQRNIMYAVTLAGGFGPTASGRVRVQPIRPDQAEVVYNLADVNDVRRALLHPPLQSGDLLVVEADSISAVYVTGLVNVQGAIPVPPGSKLSLVRAIAHAGGLRDFLEPREATLWRKLPDGTDARVKLNIADMIALKEPDIDLQAGDVIDVPHTIETRAREWAMNNIKFGPFGIGVSYDPVQFALFRSTQSNNNNGVGRILRDSFIYNGTAAVFGNNSPTVVP